MADGVVLDGVELLGLPGDRGLVFAVRCPDFFEVLGVALLEVVQRCLEQLHAVHQRSLALRNVAVRAAQVGRRRRSSFATRDADLEGVDLGVRGFQQLALLFRRIAQHLLQAIHARAQRGAVHRQGGLLVGKAARRLLQLAQRRPEGLACTEARVDLLEAGLRRPALVGELPGRLGERALQGLQAVLEGGVPRDGGPQALRVAGVLGVVVFESPQLFGMLVHGVADQGLQVVHAVLYGENLLLSAGLPGGDDPLLRLVRPRRLPLQREQAAVQGVGLHMGGLQLAAVLVRRAAHEVLQVIDTFGQRSVVGRLPLDCLQLLGMLRDRVLVLVM
mmetsp:Transcript_79177/g.242242  ORF Transcript_79177/g.242242 Transcript_79177/m.242242 type:complete len:332 (-) Transcript_79177:2175-3170(-)